MSLGTSVLRLAGVNIKHLVVATQYNPGVNNTLYKLFKHFNDTFTLALDMTCPWFISEGEDHVKSRN